MIVLYKMDASANQAFECLLVKALEEKTSVIRVNLGDKNLNVGD